MKLHELEKIHSFGRFAVDHVKRHGPTSGTELARILRERKGFDHKSHGFKHLGEFLRRYAPELVILAESDGDVAWGIRESTPEAGFVRSPPEESSTKTPLQQLDERLQNAATAIQTGGERPFLRELLLDISRWLGTGDADVGINGFSKQNWNKREERRIAACFLRLLSAAPHVFEDRTLRVFATRTFDALPDIYKRLGVSAENQTHEKLAALRSVVETADAYLEERTRALRTLDNFQSTRQKVMRALKDPIVAATYGPFFPRGISEYIDGVFRSVQEYLAAPDSERVTAYESAHTVVGSWRADAGSEATSVSERFLVRAAGNLLEALEQHFQAGPFSKPGGLLVKLVEKKHPLGSVGADAALAFEVMSVGAGPAIDVQLYADPKIDRVRLIESTRFLGNLSPGVRLGPVEFPAQVLTADPSPLELELVAEWTNADGSRSRTAEIHFLESQSGEIPWDELRVRNPYSLHAVEDDDELIGRSEVLSALESRIRSREVGSFWIHGQKRVGKTSIVKTLRTRILRESADTLVIYLEPGEYIRQSAEATVDSLATRLCEEIQEADPRFMSVQVPRFEGALSPLDSFLRAIRKVDPGRRILFILDEFDDLPIELYRLGEIGNAFFLSLRSISAKGPYGFLLVGGERMNLIVSIQGDHLNRFEPMAVDYFDRITQWNDFEELIRRPVAPWCTITDLAVTEAFLASAGNPFFAKWICNQMYQDVIRRKDAYVTEREMRRAVSAAASSAASNQFQHFWKDGIFEISNERIEERMMVRRQVLLAFADALRQDVEPSAEEIARRAAEYGVPEGETRAELQDFERRGILSIRHGKYECNIKLFERWLVERGVKDIVTSFADESAIIVHKRREEELRVSSEEIVRLTRGWGVYKGGSVGEERVRAWLNQFGDNSDQRLMFELLEGLRFYSSSGVRSKLREIHASVKAELARRGAVRKKGEGAIKTTDNVVVTTVLGAGKSGAHMQRLYVQENGIYTERAVDPQQLGRALLGVEDLRGVVVIDDFLGSGAQATSAVDELLNDHRVTLRERGITVFLGWVAGFGEAGEKLREVAAKHDVEMVIRIGDPLNNSDKAFSEQSTTFANSTDRQRALELALSRGRSLEPKHPLGYGDCQASVVFEDNCPNNSLPILWKRAADWVPLFPRH